MADSAHQALSSRTQFAREDRKSSNRHAREPVAAAAVTVINGYQLLKKIGQGGMGAVYKARQLALDREVALKILPPNIAAGESFIERFQREARASAKLSHPNIVQGIDVGQDAASGLWYFAMEFIDGPSVKQVLNTRKTLTEERALEIAAEVALALEAIDHAGMVHRDIKPDNILLTSTGVVKVADLGLLRIIESDAEVTQSGQTVGTPHYIAPEQARAVKDVDIRADLYSLGATLYHMVVGRTPFDGDSSIEIMTQHLSAEAPLAHEQNPAVSRACSDLIHALMAKDREERIQSPRELLEQIQAARARAKIEKRIVARRQRGNGDVPAHRHAGISRHESRGNSTPASRGARRSEPVIFIKQERLVYAALLIAPLLAFSAGLAWPRGESKPADANPVTSGSSSTEQPRPPQSSAAAPYAPAPIEPAHASGRSVPINALSLNAPTALSTVRWEGEDAQDHNFVSHVWLAEQLDRQNLSAGKYLNHMNDANWLKMMNKSPVSSLHATFTVNVPADGTYTLWVREYDPYVAGVWQFRWDDKRWFAVASDYPVENRMEIGKDRALVWRKYSDQTLTRGAHLFKLEVSLDEKRTISGFDCFVLTTGSATYSGVAGL